MVKSILAILITLAVGLGLGYYFAPVKLKIEQKEVIKEVEKIKYKENKNINTKIVETIYPDGRIVKETYIVDQSVVFIEKDKQLDKITENKTEKDGIKPQWFVKASTNLIPKLNSIYQVDVNRKIIGSIYLGVYGRTDKEIGIGVGLEF